jgi:glucose/arabinose dehydrogenase
MAKLLLTTLAVLLLGATAAQAASLQTVGTFAEPMFVTSSPTEPSRLFVAERDGRVMEVKNGAVTTFADIRSQVDCCPDDRGLQTIAVAPDFATSGRFYLDYTDHAGNIVIAEMRASGASAPLSSLRPLLTIPFAADANHYGGQIEIGPDGNLWISTGDGGHGGDGPGDEYHNAQNRESLLGKLLRIDPSPSGALPYTVPAGNPFPAATAPYNAIWSYGLRNPWRFSFDPASGQVVIADVGEEISEEVDALGVAASAGANFGWNCREGLLPGPATDPECASAGPFVDPVFAYGHQKTDGAWGCAIIGGYVVRDAGVPELDGRYVYADFCTAAIRSISLANPASDRSEGLSVGEATSFGRDSCGRVYVVARSGPVSRLTGSGTSNCEAAGRRASRVRVKAVRRKVQRGSKATIKVWVAPCAGRVGTRVELFRGKSRLGSRKLNRRCAVRFHPRIARPGAFRVKVAASTGYGAATSRRLLILPAKERRL